MVQSALWMAIVAVSPENKLFWWQNISRVDLSTSAFFIRAYFFTVKSSMNRDYVSNLAKASPLLELGRVLGFQCWRWLKYTTSTWVTPFQISSFEKNLRMNQQIKYTMWTMKRLSLKAHIWKCWHLNRPTLKALILFQVSAVCNVWKPQRNHLWAVIASSSEWWSWAGWCRTYKPPLSECFVCLGGCVSNDVRMARSSMGMVIRIVFRCSFPEADANLLFWVAWRRLYRLSKIESMEESLWLVVFDCSGEFAFVFVVATLVVARIVSQTTLQQISEREPLLRLHCARGSDCMQVTGAVTLSRCACTVETLLLERRHSAEDAHLPFHASQGHGLVRHQGYGTTLHARATA